MNREEAGRLFEQMHPGFFEREWIRRMDAADVYEEMILGLRGGRPLPQLPVSLPGVTYGPYKGDFDALHAAVREVDESWVQYYGEEDDVYCAMCEGRIVSFCLLDDMGVHALGGRQVRVAGPGCVGTVPAYRRMGVGLEMVRRGTQILRERGYDLSYIHYTGVAHWYAKLGYETILRWNRDGLLP